MSLQKFLARFVSAACVVASLLSSGAAAAADKRPLPPSAVLSLTGTPVPLNQAASDGQWLFIYVLPDSKVSVRLLEAVRSWELPSLSHVTIVVGGPRTAAVAFASADHGLAGVQWILDPERTAWTDLQVTGVPTLLGTTGGLIEWRLAGVLNDPSALKSVVTTWTTAAP